MRKHLLIFSLLLSLQTLAGAQQSLIDSLRRVLQKEADPVKKADTYYDIAIEAKEQNLEMAFRYADTLESMSKAAKYLKGRARAMSLRGSATKDKGDYPAALRIFKDELVFRRNIDDPKGLGKLYNNFGATYDELYQPDSSIIFYLKAVDIYEKLGDYSNIASAYSNIGNLYSDQKAHDKAIGFLEKALKIRLEHGEEKKSIYTYNNLAVAYGTKGDLDKAMEYSNKGVELALKYGNKYVAGVILGGICHLLHEKGRHEEAIPYGQRSVEYLEAANRKANLVFPLVNLAGVYNALNKPALALEYAQKGYAIMLETKQSDPLEVYYEEMANAHEKLGNYKEALFWFKKFMVLDDSLFKADNVKNLADIETRYQTAKKEAEIRDLENRQHIQKILTYSALAGILALLVVLWLSRRAYRQKQRLAEQERLLQQEKIDRLESERKVVALNAHLEGQQRERLRIAEDLHDDFGSGLSKISLLSEVAKKKAPAPAELDKIAATAKELLLKMSEIVWALNHHNDTLPSLAAYIRRYTSGFFEDSGVRCHFNVPDLPEAPLSGEVRRNVFLVVKESLHNVLKHAGADKVEIDFSLSGDRLDIRIRDNGKGFDETAFAKAGNGLLNMEKRMNAAGGAFDVRSEPGKGTVVTLGLPLALQQRDKAAAQAA